jgi:glyoxylase-like metal-dependent hydrolase (beta-lactamase superfamily II)
MMSSGLKEVAPGFYELPLGQVNAHLCVEDEGLTLIDTGYPGSAEKILAAIRQLGRSPVDLKQIVVTHCHEDHAGSLAELQRRTNATCYMHPIDAALVREGLCLRPLVRGPGLLNGVIFMMLIRRAKSTIEPARIDREVVDGEVLPFLGGARVIHAPGHCAGQIVLHVPWNGGVLFAADSCATALGLAMSPAYEDFDEGRRTLRRIAKEHFSIAVFGHGKPIATGGDARFRRKWA